MIAYEKKLNASAYVPKAPELDQEMEKKRKKIIESFSIAKNMYYGGSGTVSVKGSELEAGAEFLEVTTNQYSY